MKKRPYSDSRWRDNPMPISSKCRSCEYYRGARKCDKYPEGIPKEIEDKSFPGIEEYDENYCKYRKK